MQTSSSQPQRLNLSVVICAHNEQDWIGSTLDSLLHQSRQADEIVVVDNASTDRTADIVTDFIMQHPDSNIRLITEPNKGLHIARETGWRNSRGDLIVVTDADIHFPARWLANYEKAFLARPDIAAMTGPVRYYDALAFVNWVTRFYEHINQPQGIGTRFSTRYHLNGCNAAYRRSALEAVDGWLNMPLHLLEDMHVGAKLQDAGFKLWFLHNNKVLATFRRFKKDGWRGYYRFLFGYTVEGVYADHLQEADS